MCERRLPSPRRGQVWSAVSDDDDDARDDDGGEARAPLLASDSSEMRPPVFCCCVKTVGASFEVNAYIRLC